MKKKQELDYLNKLYRAASSARAKIDVFRNEWEEFYWNDVDSTKSQFDEQQMGAITGSYDIPISTKISYPIIEQILSFLTGTKPFPRLIGATDQDSDYAAIYAEAYKGVWYESKSNRELKNALRDMLVCGLGYIRIRTNDIFDESTFNVIHEYVRWKHVYVDPESRKEDHSDAEYIIIAYPMPKSKAEKKFDTKINPDTTNNDYNNLSPIDDDAYGVDHYVDLQDEKVKVIIKEVFQKEEKSVYITENGDVSLKRPTPIKVPNPDKIALEQQISALNGFLQELFVKQQEVSQVVAQNEQIGYNQPVQDESLELQDGEQYREAGRQIEQEMQQATEQLRQLQIAYGQAPDEVPAYQLVNEKNEKIISFDPIKTTKKRIKRTLIAGDKIIESEYLPIEHYPIVAFTMQHAGLTNKSYGMMHYILDMQKFLNKTYSMLIYDMMTHNRPKLLYAKGSIINPAQWEESYSMPSAMLEYVPNPQLPDAGRPQIIEPSPLSQVTGFVLQDMMQKIEYVSGIHGVVMGDSGSMPNTASATASLQNFGTQRVKLYARNIEGSLELLAASTIEHLQQYAPKDKQLSYIDESLQEKAVQLLNTKEDLRFKIRVDIVNDLPTVRHQMATMLAAVAGQTRNPYVADTLTKEMIKLLDMPEFTKLAEDIDAMKQLEQQNAQLQDQLKTAQGQIKTFQNNQIQSDAKHRIEKAENDFKNDLKVKQIQAENNIENQANQESINVFNEDF